MERKKIERQDVLEQILDLLCSSIGSLTNPSKIANTLQSKQTKDVSANTIRTYIRHLENAFLFSESKRYDVKGKSYFDSPVVSEQDTGLPEDKSYLECGLPGFLQESLDAMKAAWVKADRGEEYFRLDCDYCNLQTDINNGEVNQIISTEQAWYLREKYLRMERNDGI